MPSIHEILESIQVEEPTTFRNLTVFPIIGRNGSPPDYLTLDEALAEQSAHLTEVSEGGSVPELRFVNDAGMAVFLLDGEELIGAKQNRVLNVSILIAAKQSVVIPVSCVEQGRWGRQSFEFRSSPRAHYAAGRAIKMAAVSRSMNASGQRYSDQNEIWNDIGTKLSRLQSRSSTHAMNAMFEDQSLCLNEFVGAFTPTDDQVGAVFAINGRVVGLELFDSPATCRKLMAKLIRSYGLDAIDSRDAKTTLESGSAERFVSEVAATQQQTFGAVGEGQDVRLSGPELVGAALVARDRVIHLCAFRTSDRVKGIDFREGHLS